MHAHVVTARTKVAMHAITEKNVLPGTITSTDETGGDDGVESFWSHLKRSIRDTQTSVSGKYLGRYVKGFEYRFNRRDDAASMLRSFFDVPVIDAKA